MASMLMFMCNVFPFSGGNSLGNLLGNFPWKLISAVKSHWNKVLLYNMMPCDTPEGTQRQIHRNEYVNNRDQMCDEGRPENLRASLNPAASHTVGLIHLPLHSGVGTCSVKSCCC